ncbi:MAG: hypothetical protein HC905_00400 [Bacteroidales bacterium]|nr:hypothetical protein [Bacteroidales bacterium]
MVADEGWGKTGRKISLYQDIAVLAVPADKSLIDTSEILNVTRYYIPKKD